MKDALELSIGHNPVTASTSFSVSMHEQGRYTLCLYDLCRFLKRITEKNRNYQIQVNSMGLTCTTG